MGVARVVADGAFSTQRKRLESIDVLNKAHAIDAIIRINRTARRDFLEEFETQALYRYLDHLQLTLEPRGSHSRWLRDPESAAVVTRDPED